MFRRRALLLAALLPVGAAAAPPVPVVATFSVLADMIRQIGGEAVAVTMLVPFDADAHSYQPKPSDALAVARAALVVTNGLGMEGWIDRLLRAAGGHAVRVVASADVAPLVRLEAGRAAIDPHAWQDPANGVLYARTIEAGLDKADPTRAGLYRANADRFVAAIRATDAWIADQLGQVPAAARRIITSHDAFGYFGARYGIDFIGVQGLSTEGEPTPRDLAALVAQIRREHIRAVFVENMTDPRYAELLARETGAHVGPPVYSDALSPPGGPADSYLAMFRDNVPLFVAAMRGG